MISTLDATSQMFLADVTQLEQHLAKVNREITSGKKIAQPSDAPDQIDSLLQLRADQAHNQQLQTNLGMAQTTTRTADAALGSAIQLMDHAVTLAAQGASASTDTSGRQSLLEQVKAIQAEMVNLSLTNVQGRYIFGGDQGDTAAYSYDLTTGAVTQLANVTATVKMEDPAGGSFVVAKTATEIFDQRKADGTAAAGNVFAALAKLAAALGADQPDSVTQAITSLKSASAQLNSMQAFYGAVENRIQDAQTFASQYDTQLQTQLSQKQDADVVADALELTQAQTHMQAAFQMQATMPRKSLFDYLG